MEHFLITHVSPTDDDFDLEIIHLTTSDPNRNISPRRVFAMSPYFFRDDVAYLKLIDERDC